MEYIEDSVYVTVAKHNDAAASPFIGYGLACPEEARDRRDTASVFAPVSPLREEAFPIPLIDEEQFS